MGEKEILDAVALASGVEMLRSGLAGFESTTGHMKSIFEDFEGRLNKLEGEMLPMKTISEKLTLARRNITSATSKMESINECFLLEKELRGVVQKGMRGNVGAVEYLEEIRRINNAIDYFRKWPSLKSQEEAIRGLEDLSNMAAKECIDEFNRLLRTVGPAVQFQDQTNTFEPVDTLSDHVAQSLAAIGECLFLLHRDSQLRQNYTNDRRVTVKTALDSWEAKFESNPRGQEARGGGPWLRFYVDFATKVVTAERLLWERALKASCVAGCEQRNWEAESAFVLVVAPVIEKLVREVDRRLNSSLAELRDRERHHDGDEVGPSGAGGGIGGAGGGSQIRAKTRSSTASGGLVSKEGDISADVVVSLLEMSDALHKGSYTLQDILKVGDVSSSKLDKTGRPKRPSSTPPSGRGRSNKATEALSAVRRRLSQACLHTITDFVDAVNSDPKQRRLLPDDGSAHPLASNVLRGVKRLMRFRRGYEDLVKGAQLPWDPVAEKGGGSIRSNSPVGARGTTAAAQACPRLTVLVNYLVKALFMNLTEKAASYPTATLPGAALRDLFLLNNAEYVLAKAKIPFAGLSLTTPGAAPSPTPGDTFRSIFGGVPSSRDASPQPGGVRSKSPRRWGLGGSKSKEAVKRAAAARAVSEDLVGPDAGDDELQGLTIADFLTEQMKVLLQRLVEEKHASLVDTLLRPLVAAAQDDIGELKYQRGKLLTLECGRLLKAKFTAFNESWEEVFHSQLSVSVVEPDRRFKLRDELKLKCLVPYRELYETYEGVQFSKKHQEQYLKYTPDAIQEGIAQLFSG